MYECLPAVDALMALTMGESSPARSKLLTSARVAAAASEPDGTDWNAVTCIE